MKKKYIFVDPFSKETSGVTAYIKNSLLNFPDTDYVPEIFSINKNEDIRDFRFRLKEYVEKFDPSLVYLESPETLYATELLSDRYKIHIRLHGSREFGKLIQKLPLDVHNCKKEIFEIRRSSVVSAPSVAALKSSEFLYGSKIDALIYPNPINILNPTINTNNNIRDIDILFIGRWQNLKGIFYVNSIFKKFNNLNCVVASHNSDARVKNYSCFTIKNDNEKYSIYRRSKVVIIPSLFETVSQVGLEALAEGCKVVTWSHIGLREYVDQGAVKYASPWDFEEFSRITYNAVINYRMESNIDDLLFKINKYFVDAVLLLCSEKNFGEVYNLMPIKNDYIFNFIKLYDAKEGYFMSDKKVIRNRKIKKLLNNPYLFFKDMYRKRLPRKVNENDFSGLSDVSAVQARVLSPVGLKPQNNEKSNALNNIAKVNLKNFLGYVGDLKKVSIADPITKSKDWVTCIFFPENYKDYAEILGSKLNDFQDFPPFKSDRLNFIQYDNNIKITAFDLINKIDTSNKERISKINFAILINPDPITLEALRQSNQSILIVGLFLRNYCIDEKNIETICEYTDAFLVFDSFEYLDFIFDNSRRANSINSYVQIPSYLRKIVQEIGPKKIDLLMPLINAQYQPELIDYDIKRFQGLVKLKNHDFVQNLTSDNFENYLESFSSKIDELIISESVYMRYRTICEKIERGGSAAPLFKYALKDGFMFYVD